MAQFGSFDELLHSVDPTLAQIAYRLREIIITLHPQTIEVIRLGDNAASYGLGPKKMSEAYCYIMPQKQWVNLGFYHGVALPDPQGVLEGSGKRLRHVKVHSLAAIEQPAVSALVAAALAERRAAHGPTTR
ncbi:MAG: DUF1801 domain-containing protein [Chloroflexi bacterium]|nr:DUF1801 domain-containing protein [Chloroflexota bacterium]